MWRFGAVGDALRHDAGEGEQARNPLRDALSPELELMGLAVFLALPQEDQEAAVPAAERGGVDVDDAHLPGARWLGGPRRLPQWRGSQRGAFEVPVAREHRDEGVVLSPDLREGRGGPRGHGGRTVHSADSPFCARFAPIPASLPAPGRDPKWREYGGIEGCREVVAAGIARKQ